MAASKLQIHVSPLSDKISITIFQLLHSCFVVQYSNGTCADTVQANQKWIIQDGGLQTLNACVSPLPDKISTKFQRLYVRFRGQHSIGTFENTMRPNRRWTKSRWWPLSSNSCISASRQHNHKSPTAATAITIIWDPTMHWNVCDTDRPKWKYKKQHGGSLASNTYMNCIYHSSKLWLTLCDVITTD